VTNVSSAFRAALGSGAPQRVALVFENVVISNEDIDIEGGVDLREVFCSESDLAVGLTPASEITFAVFNDDGFYDEFEFGSFDAYIGVRISLTQNGSPAALRPLISVDRNALTMTVSGNGTLETYALCPLGSFIAPRPSIIRKTLIDVEAYDRMTLFDENMPDATELGITYPVTAGRLLKALCDQAGVEAESYTFLNSDLTLSKEPSFFENATMREVLGCIAQAAGANARFDRMGKLVFSWLNPVSRSFDETQYTQFEPAWYEAAQVDRVHVRNEDSTAETVIGSGNNTYVLQNNPFLRQEDTAQDFSVVVSPSRRSVYDGDGMTFTATVLGGDSSPACFWQKSADNVVWQDMAGETALTLALTASAQTTAWYYRAAVTSGGVTLYSNSAKATLKGVNT